jgi:hypothetical protein
MKIQKFYHPFCIFDYLFGTKPMILFFFQFSGGVSLATIPRGI